MPKRLKNKDFKLYNVMKEKSFKSFLIMMIFSLAIFLHIVSKVEIRDLNLKINEQSPIEIRANKEIVDKAATKKLEEDIKKSQDKIYKQNPSVQITMKGNISDFFYSAKKHNKNEELDMDEKINLLASETTVVITKEDYRKIFELNDKELDDIKMVLDDIISQVMSKGVEASELGITKATVEQIVNQSNLSDIQKDLGTDILNSVIQPNKFYDEEATNLQLEEKLANLEPVMIKENQVVLSKDEKVTKEKLDILRELGLLKENKEENIKIIIGVIILILLISSGVYGYIKLFNEDILKDNKLIMILLIIYGTIIISDLFSSISIYLMPIAVGSMLIALLVDIRLGIAANLFITLVMGIILKMDISPMAMYLLSGFIGSCVITKNQQRYDLMIKGILVGILNIISIVAFGMTRNLELRDIMIRSLYGFGNGIISGVLILGTLPIWENIFKIITPLKLMELSNPNQPLLKRLLLEAPGTYHHSIIVGNLSERAATDIGANAMLARVGSYYHDIGKLNRPYFFKENQIGMSNPHDNLSPEMSAKIILGHIPDGIELAKKNKLPKEIIDIISQHHGDTKAMYFYYQAKEKNPNVEEKDFQYIGPKPQTKESAIVMMADSSEAAVRSIEKPTKENIEEMINKIIEGKLREEQFSECDINLRDINNIKKAFVETFMGTFHERIEYPDMDEEEV